MLGLMYLGAVVLYLALMLFAVQWAWRRGRADNGSRLKGSAFALAGFLMVYLPVFWNLIPTIAAHKQLCASDAGFEALTTAEEWAQRHLALIATLRSQDLVASTKAPMTADGFDRSLDFGGALASDSRVTKIRLWGVDVTRVDQRIVDVECGDVLARTVDYQTGSRDHVALWLIRQSCFPQGADPVHKLNQFSREMKGQIK